MVIGKSSVFPIPHGVEMEHIVTAPDEWWKQSDLHYTSGAHELSSFA